MKIERFECGKIVKRNPTDLDRNRIRFNWGYHDGAAEASQGINRAERNGSDWMNTHHDPVYVAGYVAGNADKINGKYHQNSDTAFEASGMEADGYSPYRLGEIKKRIAAK